MDRNATPRLSIAFRSITTQGPIATSRVRLMLCESCASGEDWRDIQIDTQVLNEIAPLAQDRGARKSHHLPIVAGIVDERLNNLDITFIPRLHKIVAQSLNRSPEFGNAANYSITANDCLGIAETKAHIFRVKRCKLLHIHGIDHCIVVFCQVRHRILLLWYVSTRYYFDHIKMASQPCRLHRRRASCLSRLLIATPGFLLLPICGSQRE